LRGAGDALAHHRFRERDALDRALSGKVATFVERIGEFSLGIVRGQIEAAGGRLDGMVIWGDVAYTREMFFSPEYWRRTFKPVVRALSRSVMRTDCR